MAAIHAASYPSRQAGSDHKTKNKPYRYHADAATRGVELTKASLCPGDARSSGSALASYFSALFVVIEQDLEKGAVGVPFLIGSRLKTREYIVWRANVQLPLCVSFTAGKCGRSINNPTLLVRRCLWPCGRSTWLKVI